MAKARIKKGDMVVVISGKDRDRSMARRVLEIDAARGRVEIEYFGEEDLQRVVNLLLGDHD